ncbi:Small auxin-up RNA - like 10 [Theobroma cacao]|nr:Small auxin-up RNA - like 10 [Theobroma cacao]
MTVPVLIITSPGCVKQQHHFPNPAPVHAKQIIRRETAASEIPRGHLAVYVGESQKRRFLIPHPSFQELPNQAEAEFGFDHPIGGLIILCAEEAFIELACSLNCS